ncbi:MAG: ECF RNA polymerase sigma factor SigW [Phycisphaerae bacterium]|nr:MAG: ECF RNA polymerase sigma factor SigW [Phycisphaerae bacterium]
MTFRAVDMEMTPTRLTDLIQRAQAHESEAFDELIDAFGTRLHGYLYRLIGSRDEADDLLQDVFLRVVRMIDSYQHDHRFEGWLFRIATNLVRDRIRRVGRAPKVIPFEAGSSNAGEGGNGWGETEDVSAPDPEASMRLADDVDALQKGLAKLPEAEREVIMLRHFSDLSFLEIATLMNTPLGTALARAHRGLQKLRDLMNVDDARSQVG